MMKRNAQRLLREETAQRNYHAHLDKIANGDDEAIKKIGSIEKWMTFASGGMSISENGYSIDRSTSNVKPMDSSYFHNLNHTLDTSGFAMLPSDAFNWESSGVDFAAIARTMENLCSAGWPPVFIFMFDQPWKLCHGLFDLMVSCAIM